MATNTANWRRVDYGMDNPWVWVIKFKQMQEG